MEKNLITVIVLSAVAVFLWIFGIARKKTRVGFFSRFLLWAIILYCVMSALLGLGVIK